MSRSKNSIMKMPENIKRVDSSVHNVNYAGYYDAGTKGIAKGLSVTWLAGMGAFSFSVIPISNVFYFIPITLTVVAGIIGFCTGFFFLADGTGSGIRKHMKSQSSALGSSKDYERTKSGVKISGWDRGAGTTIAHFLLPVRIFKKIKVYESCTYFPYEDRYVKEVHYLTFSGFVRVKENFDGHRAVFQKALDSF